MSEITLPCKVEPWDGRIVDANDMYVDSVEVLLRVNNHEKLIEALLDAMGAMAMFNRAPGADRDQWEFDCEVKEIKCLLATLEAEKGGEL